MLIKEHVSKGDFLAHHARMVWCHAPWEGDHDGTLTDHTAEDTLDKSRRRDTMFPQSLELQAYHSDCLWLAISHVYSSLEKTSVKVYTRSRAVTVQNQSWLNLAHSKLNNSKKIRKNETDIIREKWMVGKGVPCPNAGKQRSITACQRFHKCRYVRVTSPDNLQTPKRASLDTALWASCVPLLEKIESQSSEKELLLFGTEFDSHTHTHTPHTHTTWLIGMISATMKRHLPFPTNDTCQSSRLIAVPVLILGLPSTSSCLNLGCAWQNLPAPAGAQGVSFQRR